MGVSGRSFFSTCVFLSILLLGCMMIGKSEEAQKVNCGETKRENKKQWSSNGIYCHCITLVSGSLTTCIQSFNYSVTLLHGDKLPSLKNFCLTVGKDAL